MKRYVQYGCGFSAPATWINYDASPTLRFERTPLLGKLYKRNSQRFPANVLYGNIVKGLPEIDNSCDGIYCSHILEHLTYEDCKKALKNTFRILKPGGTFRCVLPDLRQAAIDYLESYENLADPGYQFLRSINLGLEQNPKTLASFVKSLLGNSKHLWMWDEKTLSKELRIAGFTNLRPCKYNDSSDSHFSYVEEDGRFYRVVAIECRK